MKSIISSVVSTVTLGLALGLANPLHAQVFTTGAKPLGGQGQAITNAADFEVQLAQAEAALAAQRQDYPAYFDAAYAQYPAIPDGILEAIAYVQSRWVNLQPVTQADNHQHMPHAYGVMGLYHGEGFADQVAHAAQLLGVSEKQVISDVPTNILAAAALLDELLAADGKNAYSYEAMAPLLGAYAGFAKVDDSNIQRYARDNFAYDVLLILDRGVDDNDIRIAEQPIAWEDTFDTERLIELRAPFIRLDATQDRVIIDGYHIDPIDETLQKDVESESTNSDARGDDNGSTRSTDYGPALYVQSPYHTTRTASISSVTIHTMEGSYAGTISWFQNNPYSVSAHYLVRSSDGQITQMVRESRRAHHVGVHNSATLGIEHEGFVANGSSWYTTAMYNASSALTRHFCSTYAINCANAYNGPAHSGVVVLSTSIVVKGHQHYSSNTHVDPGIFWDWSRYYGLLNPGGGGGGSTTILDSFESSEGHFTNTPAYSGSTVGISTASTADRTCSIARNGSCSEQIKLVDNTSTSASWAVRFLSGGGSPGSNTGLTRSGGRIGFWVYSGGSGMSVGVGIDDSDGTERSTSKSIPANAWTFVEWNLDDAAQWNAWVNGNGAITASSVTVDAIWIYRAQTSFDVYVYIDDVQYNR